MTEYVAGFMFNQPGTVVALIHKQRPAWQKGRWNAIGGHIEPGESPEQAMVREFKEETSVYSEDWKKFAVLLGDGSWRVHFFTAFSDMGVSSVKTTTDEVVGTFGIRTAMCRPDLMTNIPWLLQMALSMENERAASFVIQEMAA